jgi:hypothetical protein
MRVISQWKDVDLDYETSSFMIEDNITMQGIENASEKVIPEEDIPENSNGYIIVAVTNVGNRFAMAYYSNIEKAQKALTDMSSNYVRYLITDSNSYMTMTDALDCELDKPFNKLEIKEMKATVYQFPEED